MIHFDQLQFWVSFNFRAVNFLVDESLHETIIESTRADEINSWGNDDD